MADKKNTKSREITSGVANTISQSTFAPNMAEMAESHSTTSTFNQPIVNNVEEAVKNHVGEDTYNRMNQVERLVAEETFKDNNHDEYSKLAEQNRKDAEEMAAQQARQDEINRQTSNQFNAQTQYETSQNYSSASESTVSTSQTYSEQTYSTSQDTATHQTTPSTPSYNDITSNNASYTADTSVPNYAQDSAIQNRVSEQENERRTTQTTKQSTETYIEPEKPLQAIDITAPQTFEKSTSSSSNTNSNSPFNFSQPSNESNTQQNTSQYNDKPSMATTNDDSKPFDMSQTPTSQNDGDSKSKPQPMKPIEDTAQPQTTQYDSAQQTQHEQPQTPQYESTQQTQYEQPKTPQYDSTQQTQHEQPQTPQYDSTQQTQYEQPQTPQYDSTQQTQYEQPQTPQYDSTQQTQYEQPHTHENKTQQNTSTYTQSETAKDTAVQQASSNESFVPFVRPSTSTPDTNKSEAGSKNNFGLQQSDNSKSSATASSFNEKKSNFNAGGKTATDTEAKKPKARKPAQQNKDGQDTVTQQQQTTSQVDTETQQQDGSRTDSTTSQVDTAMQQQDDSRTDSTTSQENTATQQQDGSTTLQENMETQQQDGSRTDSTTSQDKGGQATSEKESYVPFVRPSDTQQTTNKGKAQGDSERQAGKSNFNTRTKPPIVEDKPKGNKKKPKSQFMHDRDNKSVQEVLTDKPTEHKSEIKTTKESGVSSSETKETRTKKPISPIKPQHETSATTTAQTQQVRSESQSQFNENKQYKPFIIENQDEKDGKDKFGNENKTNNFQQEQTAKQIMKDAFKTEAESKFNIKNAESKAEENKADSQTGNKSDGKTDGKGKQPLTVETLTMKDGSQIAIVGNTYIFTNWQDETKVPNANLIRQDENGNKFVRISEEQAIKIVENNDKAVDAQPLTSRSDREPLPIKKDSSEYRPFNMGNYDERVGKEKFQSKSKSSFNQTDTGKPPPNNTSTGKPPPNNTSTGKPPPNITSTGRPPPNNTSTGKPPPNNTGTGTSAPPDAESKEDTGKDNTKLGNTLLTASSVLEYLARESPHENTGVQGAKGGLKLLAAGGRALDSAITAVKNSPFKFDNKNPMNKKIHGVVNATAVSDVAAINRAKAELFIEGAKKETRIPGIGKAAVMGHFGTSLLLNLSKQGAIAVQSSYDKALRRTEESNLGSKIGSHTTRLAEKGVLKTASLSFRMLKSMPSLIKQGIAQRQAVNATKRHFKKAVKDLAKDTTKSAAQKAMQKRFMKKVYKNQLRAAKGLGRFGRAGQLLKWLNKNFGMGLIQQILLSFKLKLLFMLKAGLLIFMLIIFIAGLTTCVAILSGFAGGAGVADDLTQEFPPPPALTTEATIEYSLGLSGINTAVSTYTVPPNVAPSGLLSIYAVPTDARNLTKVGTWETQNISDYEWKMLNAYFYARFGMNAAGELDRRLLNPATNSALRQTINELLMLTNVVTYTATATINIGTTQNPVWVRDYDVSYTQHPLAPALSPYLGMLTPAQWNMYNTLMA